MGTSKVLLLGDPVAHSLSPAMQNAAFRALAIDAEYEARRVTSAELGAVAQELHGEPYLGANVTIPHKEAVLGLVDSLSELVERIGAANTLVRDGDRLRAENTDVHGFVAALQEARVDAHHRRALVLGAGGAARAVIAALADAGAAVDVAARRRLEAEAVLASADQPSVRAREWPRSPEGYDLVVNTTPLGMNGEDPLSGFVLAPPLVVFDLVPTAEPTPLLRRARGAGCETIDGLLMLLHQAAASFELWTGRRAPLEAMRAALPRRP